MSTLDEARNAAIEGERVLRSAVERARTIADQARRDRASLRGRDLNANSAAAEMQKINQRAADEIADLRIIVGRAENDVRAFVARANVADSGGGTEGELRRQAAWTRIRAVLDVEPEPVLAATKIAQEAATRTDRAALEALRRELPSYITARGGSRLRELEAVGESTGHTAAELGFTMPRDLEVYLDVVGGPPAAMHARTLEDRVNRGLPRVVTGINLTEQYMTQADPAYFTPAYEAAYDDSPNGMFVQQADHAETMASAATASAAVAAGTEGITE